MNELPSMTKENTSELRQIADGAAHHIHALKALKRPTDSWDDPIVYLLSSILRRNEFGNPRLKVLNCLH